MGGAGGIIDQAMIEIIEVPSPIAQLHVQVSFVASAHISLDNSRDQWKTHTDFLILCKIPVKITGLAKITDFSRHHNIQSEI